MPCIVFELQLTVHQPWSTNSKLEQGRTHEHQIVLLTSALASENYSNELLIKCGNLLYA